MESARRTWAEVNADDDGERRAQARAMGVGERVLRGIALSRQAHVIREAVRAARGRERPA